MSADKIPGSDAKYVQIRAAEITELHRKLEQAEQREKELREALSGAYGELDWPWEPEFGPDPLALEPTEPRDPAEEGDEI